MCFKGNCLADGIPATARLTAHLVYSQGVHSEEGGSTDLERRFPIEKYTSKSTDLESQFSIEKYRSKFWLLNLLNFCDTRQLCALSKLRLVLWRWLTPLAGICFWRFLKILKVCPRPKFAQDSQSSLKSGRGCSEVCFVPANFYR